MSWWTTSTSWWRCVFKCKSKHLLSSALWKMACFPQQSVCLQSFPLAVAESQFRSNRLRLQSPKSKERRMLSKHPFLIRVLHWKRWIKNLYLRIDCKANYIFFYLNSEAALAFCITSGYLWYSAHTCDRKIYSLFLSSLEQVRRVDVCENSLQYSSSKMVLYFYPNMHFFSMPKKQELKLVRGWGRRGKIRVLVLCSIIGLVNFLVL